MTGEKVDFEQASGGQGKAAADGPHNEMSTIAFPYIDLDSAVDVARAVYERSGHGSCEIDELAAEMSQTVSGAFRLKTAAAKVFGLIDKDGRSAFRLTQLGQRAVIPETERGARVEAFLTVPLYSAIYDQYRGHNLPPAKALEREMHRLGVSSKQTDKARQAFERSARQSGFFDDGDSRLVRPRTEGQVSQASGQETGVRSPAIQSKSDSNSDASPGNGGGSGGGSGGGNHHPFIAGLLETLPATGANWPHKERAKWLRLAANAFDLIYANDDDGEINIACATNKTTGQANDPS